MIPKLLSISGFLSYRDPVEIEFSSFQVACITGANGSGKSSILDAITWSLFGQARKRDDSIINLSSETAAVDFQFSYENIEYRTKRSKTRGKSTILEFQIMTPDGSWKPLSERAMRKTEDRIVETLRLDYETFVNASFFLQGKADQFTQQRPGDRKRILSNILGLEVWETYRKRTADKRREHDRSIISINGRLAEINAELGEEQIRGEDLKELNTQLDEIQKTRKASEKTLNIVRKQKISYDEQQKNLDGIKSRISGTDQDLTNTLNTISERDQKREQTEAVISDAEDIETRFSQLLVVRNEIKQGMEQSEEFHALNLKIQEHESVVNTEKARLETELLSLNAEQKKVDEAKGQLLTLDEGIQKVKAEISGLEETVKEKEQVNLSLQQKNAALGEIKAQNTQLKLEMDELKGRIDQLKVTTGAECPLCGQPLSEEERKNLLEELTKEGTEKGDLFRQNKADLISLETEIADLKSKAKSYKITDAALLEKTSEVQALETNHNQYQTQVLNWQENGHPKTESIKVDLAEEKFAQPARAEIAKLRSELAGLAYNQDHFRLMQQQEQELSPADEEKKKLDNSKAALEPLIREIETLNLQKETMEKNLALDNAQFDSLTASLAVQLADIGDLQELEKDFFTLQERENKVRFSVGAAQQKVNVLDQLRDRKAELNLEREEQARLVSNYKSLEAAFGKNGVPAMLIEQALPQIELAANEILSRLSNGSMFISFVTQEKYKDKKREDMRETLEIQIQDGAGIRDYEMYSGGEAFKINFALRMALSEVLAQRAGARLQTLVIDEGFGSQDEQGRQRLIEAINIIKSDFEKILVITHIDALKDAFDNQIQVTKSERGSLVEIM